MARHGKPDGSHVIHAGFIKVLAAREIRISMGGKGAWRDTIFGERLGGPSSNEEVILHAYASVTETRNPIRRYRRFYSSRPVGPI